MYRNVYQTHSRQLEKSETCEFGCYTKLINNYNAETGEISLNEVSIERGCNQKKGVSLQAGCKVSLGFGLFDKIESLLHRL